MNAHCSWTKIQFGSYLNLTFQDTFIGKSPAQLLKVYGLVMLLLMQANALQKWIIFGNNFTSSIMEAIIIESGEISWYLQRQIMEQRYRVC